MRLDTFIHRPVLSTVISVILVILGFIGLFGLPVEQYPDIAPPTIFVQAYYQGADAQTVQNSVLSPLEEQINGVEGMTYMTSTASNEGSAMIRVLFEQGYDADMAQVNVQNRVSQASALLPQEVTKAGVTVQKRQNSTILMLMLTSEDGQYDESFLANYANINVIPAIKRVAGVGECEAMGAKLYTMRLWLDPAKMQQYKLIPSDITNVLAEQNIEAAPGKFGEQSGNQYEYTMRYTGRLKSPEEFGDMIIKSTNDGQTLRVKDVARTEMGALYYVIKSNANGKPSVMLMISQTAGSNATEVIEGVKKVMAEQNEMFPPGMKFEYMLDVSEFLFASIEEVVETLLEAFLLVFLVVYFFLQDFRSTLIPLIAVPVSLIGTFFFLYLFGFSLNLLTLSALVLAIAIVVDDAIVVVEAVHAKLDMGYKSSRTAASDAMNEISGAIISITLVMSAVFIPVSFLGGTAGTFYREFGVTMAISIIISAVNALTLSPALCAVFLKAKDENGEEKKPNRIEGFLERFHTSFNAAYGRILEKYRKNVRFFIDHKVLAFGLMLLGIVVLGITGMTTKTGLVPDEDTGTVMVTISTPPGSSLETTDKVMNQVDEMLATNPAIQSRQRITGYNLIAGQGSNQGTFIVKLKNWKDRNMGQSSMAVLGMIYKQTAAIKGAQILAFQPPMVTGFSASNGLSFSLQDRTGGSIDQFTANSDKFLAALNKRPEISMAMTAFRADYPQYVINVDVAKCKQAGISPAVVLTTMQGYYGGLYTSNFNAYGKLYRVMIQSDPKLREDIKSLNNVYVRTGSGEMSPVSEFVQLTKIYGPQTIGRFNLFTSIDVNATPAEGYSSGDAINAVKEVARETLPTGYTYEFSGLTRSEQESSNSTMLVFILCLTFVYLILSAQYESYILPLSVILSIPFGLAGAFLFTKLFGHQNDIYMQISLIMLIGLLAKNAILIVQFALERRRMGMAITWSAILGSAARLRPILMTSLAMIIGLLPMMFAMGVGANSNRTLGAATVGGMLIGMLCQIFIVPTLFVIFQYLQEKLQPIKFENEENPRTDTELIQYMQPSDAKYTGRVDFE
ncbi:MAG: efflux RND transporter permease subunit [Paludibacteraceae bacterium]|nr:efflux RND transporter permease subunit [Paludibacteraceae bacterium]